MRIASYFLYHITYKMNSDYPFLNSSKFYFSIEHAEFFSKTLIGILFNQ